MIYPLEQDYLTWASQYDLRVRTGECPKCKKSIITNIPFALKGFRGLKSEDHGCGEEYTRKTMIPVEKAEIDFLSEIASII